MKAGPLRNKVQILRQEQVRAGGGQVVGQWVEYAKVWANFQRLSGLGTIKADADVSLIKASVRIRFRSDVDDTMRVQHGGVVYEVKAVLPDVAHREHIDLVVQSIPGVTP
ncbi:phage head closure protein [Bordetella avium]|uniref:phage head closure protein n=1 Tax=Bordetella avium TaxID=521 RepID=UPI001F4EB35D|nr:phage head closure protein [Bordetella avium]